MDINYTQLVKLFEKIEYTYIKLYSACEIIRKDWIYVYFYMYIYILCIYARLWVCLHVYIDTCVLVNIYASVYTTEDHWQIRSW